MKLPEDFQFSQGVLQDYVDCRRRFQLRHLRRLAWPAVAAEPALAHERHLELGVRFHRLVQQHQLGLSPDDLAPLVADPTLHAWWTRYLAHPLDLPARRHAELVLAAPLGAGPRAGHRLVGKYDLVAVEAGGGGRWVIVDWKTGRRPPRDWLTGRMQTRVYRYLLVAAGAHLGGGRPPAPEQVEMVYWFAEDPGRPERFPYDAAAFAADGERLAELARGLADLDEGDFPLTEDRTRCRTCTYRSLCERGEAAGTLAAEDPLAEGAQAAEDDPLESAERFDLDQISEIAF